MTHLLLYAPRGSVRDAILLGKDGAAFNRQAGGANGTAGHPIGMDGR